MGRATYELLTANSVLPSVSLINKTMENYMPAPVEGVCRFDELNVFLEQRNLRKQVWIGEDATSLTGRIEYDSRTDTLIGFSSPLDPDTGFPIPYSFPATTFKDIIKALDNNHAAKYVNVLMARSTDKVKSPAFCLAVYGTDNSFSAEQVLQRWNFIKDELAKRGIEMLAQMVLGAT
uniref:Uncharacterized protein n=1 Tax=Lutzomyia longipalpis TaxID=7200 RepID=A0A1B0CXZ1_LUTLO